MIISLHTMQAFPLLQFSKFSCLFTGGGLKMALFLYYVVVFMNVLTVKPWRKKKTWKTTLKKKLGQVKWAQGTGSTKINFRSCFHNKRQTIGIDGLGKDKRNQSRYWKWIGANSTIIMIWRFFHITSRDRELSSAADQSLSGFFGRTARHCASSSLKQNFETQECTVVGLVIEGGDKKYLTIWKKCQIMMIVKLAPIHFQ